jgi:hypothetical protein
MSLLSSEVCACACAFACVRACACVCIYTNTCIYIHIHTHIHTHTHTHICICGCVSVSQSVSSNTDNLLPPLFSSSFLFPPPPQPPPRGHARAAALAGELGAAGRQMHRDAVSRTGTTIYIHTYTCVCVCLCVCVCVCVCIGMPYTTKKSQKYSVTVILTSIIASGTDLRISARIQKFWAKLACFARSCPSAVPPTRRARPRAYAFAAGEEVGRDREWC